MLSFEEILKNLLQKAIDRDASDIHLCTGSKPIFRISGRLISDEEDYKMDIDTINALVNLILPVGKGEILQKNRVLDFSFSRPGIGRFRANVYSQRGSFAVALRVLPFDVPSFDSLGLPEGIKKITSKPKGLFLTTGATGSGKSTTQAGLLDLFNEHDSYHIITIEDPIEHLHKHKKSYITQREIGMDAISFSDALRSALREDPDIIMVGEMRDAETISIALTAAETGHLVLSTLHTVGAAKSIDRIIDAFPTEQHEQIRSQLAAVFEGVISQQLIPRADGKGVALATEVMFTTPAIRNLIREGKQYQINSILQTGQNLGMHMMEDSLAKLVKSGTITEEEATNRAQDTQLLKQFMMRR